MAGTIKNAAILDIVSVIAAEIPVTLGIILAIVIVVVVVVISTHTLLGFALYFYYNDNVLGLESTFTRSVLSDLIYLQLIMNSYNYIVTRIVQYLLHLKMRPIKIEIEQKIKIPLYPWSKCDEVSKETHALKVDNVYAKSMRLTNTCSEIKDLLAGVAICRSRLQSNEV